MVSRWGVVAPRGGILRRLKGRPSAMQQSGLDAVAFGVGDLLPFRFLEVVEGYFHSQIIGRPGAREELVAPHSLAVPQSSSRCFNPPRINLN